MRHLARQLAELSLKAILGPAKGHNLVKLLKQLEEADDDVFAAGDDQHLVVEFIRDLHRRDPNDDEGRYPATTKGVPSLATVCCANPPLFREYITILFMYTQGRISRAAQMALSRCWVCDCLTACGGRGSCPRSAASHPTSTPADT